MQPNHHVHAVTDAAALRASGSPTAGGPSFATVNGGVSLAAANGGSVVAVSSSKGGA